MEYRDVHRSGESNSALLIQIEKSNMSERQKDKIKQFVSDLRIGKSGKKVKDRRINSYLQFLLKLHNYFKKDLETLSDKQTEQFYKDLTDNKIKKNNGMPYSISSKDEFTKTLKRYLGWCWGRDSKKYSASVRWMKEDYKKSNKRAVTLEQIQGVVDKEKYVRNKCLIMFLFDSGARIEEALNVRISDLKVVGKGNSYYMVHIRGKKTEESDRTIAVPLVTKYLNKWIKEHPAKKENDFENAFLFPINYDNARKILREITKKVLKFPLKPHELRNSSATHYIQNGGFGAENIGGFYYRYGWKFGSKEALTYIKTYLYGGELGQDKVVKAVISDRIENLEKQIEDLKQSQTTIIKRTNEQIKIMEDWQNLVLKYLKISPKDKELLESLKPKSFSK